jgi:hypothetical protein
MPVSGSKRNKNQQTGPEKRAIKRDQRAIQRDQAAQASLHDMGGNIGPASIRGSGVVPGGQREREAQPESGYSEAIGYTAVRDDDWQVTAGADKVWTGEPDEQDTFGPSPVAVPRQPGGPPGEPGHPGFRVRGPVDEAEYGLIDDEDPSPDDPDADSGVTAGLRGDGGHVTTGLRWTDTDTDDGDPDIGSGRTWE